MLHAAVQSLDFMNEPPICLYSGVRVLYDAPILTIINFSLELSFVYGDCCSYNCMLALHLLIFVPLGTSTAVIICTSVGS